MEAFSLLKFWKSSTTTAAAGGLVTSLPAAANTVLAAVSDEDAETGNAGDDGPFFDLEFTDANSDDEEGEEEGEEEKSVAELVDGDDREVEVVEEESETEDERTDPNLPVSPSEDFFKLLAFESGSDPSPGKPQVFPVSLLRSATRLQILMSGLKKSSKSTQAQAQAEVPSDSKQSQQ